MEIFSWSGRRGKELIMAWKTLALAKPRKQSFLSKISPNYTFFFLTPNFRPKADSNLKFTNPTQETCVTQNSKFFTEIPDKSYFCPDELKWKFFTQLHVHLKKWATMIQGKKNLKIGAA